MIAILSSNPERDRYIKKALYERVGVPEYWVVDPKSSQVEVWVPAADGRYTRRGLWCRSDTATLAAFPQVAIPLEAVFRLQPSDSGGSP